MLDYPGINQARELLHFRAVLVKQLKSKSHIPEVDEAQLCGSSLLTRPIALPAG